MVLLIQIYLSILSLNDVIARKSSTKIIERCPSSLQKCKGCPENSKSAKRLLLMVNNLPEKSKNLGIYEPISAMPGMRVCLKCGIHLVCRIYSFAPGKSVWQLFLRKLIENGCRGFGRKIERHQSEGRRETELYL